MTRGAIAVFTLTGAVGGVTIACDSGMLWITQAGDIRDHLVRPGMDFTVSGEGTVTVQLLEHGEVTIRLSDTVPGRLRGLFRKCGLVRAANAARRPLHVFFPTPGRSGCCAGRGSNGLR